MTLSLWLFRIIIHMFSDMNVVLTPIRHCQWDVPRWRRNCLWQAMSSLVMQILMASWHFQAALSFSSRDYPFELLLILSWIEMGELSGLLSNNLLHTWFVLKESVIGIAIFQRPIAFQDNQNHVIYVLTLSKIYTIL